MFNQIAGVMPGETNIIKEIINLSNLFTKKIDFEISIIENK